MMTSLKLYTAQPIAGEAIPPLDLRATEPRMKVCECGCGGPVTSRKKASRFRPHHFLRSLSAEARKRFSEAGHGAWMSKGRPRRIRPLAERLWEKVDKAPGHGPAGDCWVWTGFKNASGYGQINVNGRPINAHRVAYEIVNGPIAKGRVACHRCDFPPCVRPDHIFDGSAADNHADMRSKGRQRDPIGERHPRVKLSVEQVVELRRLHDAGLLTNQSEAARQLGLRSCTVSSIVRRKSWRHIA